MQAILRRLRRLRRDDSGAIALMLALSLIPLSIAALGSVDLMRALNVRAQLQDALDAAALAGARLAPATHSPPSSDDEANLESVGEANLAQNLAASPAAAEVDSKSFQYSDADESVVVANATARVDTILAQLVLGGKPLEVSAHSEVRASSSNVEVSLVLDITGSMSQRGKLDALKSAATDLVNIVVKDQQTPYYSKVAIVPYSTGVNVGPYLSQVEPPVASNCRYNQPGCASISFTPMQFGGAQQPFRLSNCVTERVEVTPTDKPAGPGQWMGWQYPSTAPSWSPSYNPCPSATIQLLSSDKAALTSTIDGLTAGGSTAGQVGLAWGWYLVSPTFLKKWPIKSEQMPGPYNAKPPKKVMKVVVLMTDGMFNTAYADGVIASDSGSQSGDPGDHIAYAAQDGDSFTQAKKLCDAMKAKGVVVYTVGLDLQHDDVDPQKAADLMSYCASSPAQVYLPGNGTDLQTAFHAIAQDIDSLRLTK